MNTRTSRHRPGPLRPSAVWLAIAYTWLVDSGRAFGRRLADDSGVEDSPSKLHVPRRRRRDRHRRRTVHHRRLQRRQRQRPRPRRAAP